MRECRRLLEVVQHELFPQVEALSIIEAKFGEAVSLMDIDGPVAAGRADPAAAEDPQNRDAQALQIAETTTAGHHDKVPRKAPTDARNPDYESERRRRELERGIQDYLSDQAQIKQLAYKSFEAAKATKEKDRSLDGVPARFQYSGQHLNYVGLKKLQQRRQIENVKDTHFTNSLDFLSAAIPAVDMEAKDGARMREEQPSSWKTTRGFRYPMPRKANEFYIHPMKPSQSRIDALREPWVENELVAKPLERETKLPDGQPDFDSLPSKGNPPFSALQLPEYERDFDRTHIGSLRRLPRGKLANEGAVNIDFTRSVFLDDDGPVVDPYLDRIPMHVSGFNVRDRPLQVDRAKDILKDPPAALPLRRVRNARLPSGKRVKLQAAPISALATEEYEDPRDFTVDLRKDQPEHFSSRDPTGKPIDFTIRIHPDRMKKKVDTILGHTKIRPMGLSEAADSRWG